jgi:hypothetical protein
MKKYDNKGRSKTRTVMLHYPLIESDAWRTLPPPACKIFIELRRRFNGFNNGDISLSCRDAAELTGCSKQSALRHFNSLIKHGFIDIHNKGVMRNRNASTWYLTMEACEYHPRYPTNRWRDFKKTSVPPQNDTVPTIEL